MRLVLISTFSLIVLCSLGLNSSIETSDSKKQNALKVLRTRCNSCHFLSNPFMIFNAKNMDKRAVKVRQQVFELQRMPKGEERLSANERAVLLEWLKSTKTQDQ